MERKPVLYILNKYIIWNSFSSCHPRVYHSSQMLHIVRLCFTEYNFSSLETIYRSSHFHYSQSIYTNMAPNSFDPTHPTPNNTINNCIIHVSFAICIIFLATVSIIKYPDKRNHPPQFGLITAVSILLSISKMHHRNQHLLAQTVNNCAKPKQSDKHHLLSPLFVKISSIMLLSPFCKVYVC